MLDATKVSHIKGGGKLKETGFVFGKAQYVPETHSPPMPFGQASQLLYYALIHPENGTIVGPDQIYWVLGGVPWCRSAILVNFATGAPLPACFVLACAPPSRIAEHRLRWQPHMKRHKKNKLICQCLW